MSDLDRLVTLKDDDPVYPRTLKSPSVENAPKKLTMVGNPALLNREKLGLICSAKCPGSIILKTYEMTKHLAATNWVVVSGFHSPLEKECLEILLRGKASVIICPARSLEGMRIPAKLRKPIDAGTVLLVSAIHGKNRRATKRLTALRNDFVAAIAAKIFIPHAALRSSTMELARKIIHGGNPILTFNAPENNALIEVGAQQIERAENFELLKL